MNIPSGSTVIVDSSVLFAIGGPENEKYQAFERYFERKNINVKMPERVAEELGESPDEYEYQRNRLRAASESGWLDSAETDFGVSGVSNVVDDTRDRMANISSDDVSQDEIEKTDTVLAGLAYQYSRISDHVAVLVSDRVAERAIRDVLTSRTKSITVVEGREFINHLVD
ncbi:hypothetical protein ACEU6E_05595 [Halorutilales archaeon Cl-col2-1]